MKHIIVKEVVTTTHTTVIPYDKFEQEGKYDITCFMEEYLDNFSVESLKGCEVEKEFVVTIDDSVYQCGSLET